MPDVPMVNHTAGLGEDEPVDESMLDEIAVFYSTFAARYYIALSPTARPPDLRSRLAKRGFTRGYDWMKFTRGTDDLPNVVTALEVREIGSDPGADFAQVVVAGYDLPHGAEPAIASVPGCDGCIAYVAYEGATPAAAGAIFVSGDVAWLGFAATAPQHQRKGGQGAILAARLERARDLGVESVVTETGVMQEGRPSNSYRNILRSGFEEAYVRENYLSP
jgi:GNAT superfamily N-acetyltransferase